MVVAASLVSAPGEAKVEILTVRSKVTWQRELDRSRLVMDAEGEQMDMHRTYLVVMHRKRALRIPWGSVIQDAPAQLQLEAGRTYSLRIERRVGTDGVTSLRLLELKDGAKVLYALAPPKPPPP